MKVMVIVKATKESEAGMMPDEKVIAEMGKFKRSSSKPVSCSPERGYTQAAKASAWG
jgi:hypothetical protein